MNKPNKAEFTKTSLKALADPLDLTNQPCCTLVIDGGWLLYMVKWEQNETRQEIANSYLRYVQCLGRRCQKIIVVFDGYSRSPKQYICNGPDSTLGDIRYKMFSRKAAAGVIKPETLPPTEGAAAQHSIRAYLQTRNWILPQSMSLNPSDYGWTLCAWV